SKVECRRESLDGCPDGRKVLAEGRRNSCQFFSSCAVAIASSWCPEWRRTANPRHCSLPMWGTNAHSTGRAHGGHPAIDHRRDRRLFVASQTPWSFDADIG